MSAEKLDAVSVHISGISKTLRQYKLQAGADLDSNGDADAGGPGEDDAGDFDMEEL